jgi:dihydrofolate synthase/folylpolyglutamate synthase
MMQDKDVKKSLSILSKLDCSIFCTEIPEMARSMKSDKLLQIAKEVGIKSLSTYKNPIDAVLSSLSHSEITICCGSLYLIGYIKKNLKLLENKIDSI